MSDRPSPSPNPETELKKLIQENTELKRFKIAFDVHKELTKSFVTLLQRTTGKLLLRSILRQTLEIAVRLTNAKESSLFWLNEKGIVTESILARGAVIRDEKDTLIGEVLNKGLAGWVYTNRKLALVSDTSQDPRWLELPSQPYQAGSVLCIPIIRGKSLLAILTLMHHQIGHFDPELATLMEICAEQIALVLDQVRFYSENFQITQEIQANNQATQTTNKFREPLSDLALLVIGKDGQFISVDQKLADIFGYIMSDLVALGSLLSVATEDHREALNKRINQCIAGEIDHVLVGFKGLCFNKTWLKVEFYGRKTKLLGKTVILGTLRKF